jgi:hypothetical protein
MIDNAMIGLFGKIRGNVAEVTEYDVRSARTPNDS